MKKVGSRELKNRLGAYLKRVRRGERLIITDRGEPVAQLTPVEPAPPARKTAEEILRELAAAGHIRLSTGPFSAAKPIPSTGKPASRIIIEDRR
jgi:prevent-host-death family protein